MAEEMPPRHFCGRLALYCKPLDVHISSASWYRSAVTPRLQITFSSLFHRSVFGEDALVNVSVEKKEDNDGKLAGYIRIRSKTQGIALSLGDRITSVQRGLQPNKKH